MDNYDNLKCLTGLDLSDLEVITSTKDGFATADMKAVTSLKLLVCKK
jgi:hypothetical protein